MQGQKSSVSPFPDNLTIDKEATSLEPVLDSQMSRNSMHGSSRSLLPESRIASSGSNTSYLHRARREGRGGEWSLGQTSSSSSQNRVDQNEGKPFQTWSIYPRAAIPLEDAANVDSDRDHTANGSFILRSSGYRSHEDDGDQVLDGHSFSISMGALNEQTTYAGASSDSLDSPSMFGGYVVGNNENRIVSLDDQRLSCKRKASEVMGPSSRAGSSSFSPNAEPELLNSGLGVGIGETVSETPSASNTWESAENSRHSCVNDLLHWQDPMMPENPYPMEANFGNVDVSSSQNFSRFVLCNRSSDSNPASRAENRNLQSRWNGSSSSRTSRSSSSNMSFVEEDLLHEETTRGSIPRSISGHPIFVPATERRTLSQNPINWSFASGNNVDGNVASSSRRLSEIVRRSLLPSVGTESGAQSGSLTASSSDTSQEHAFTFGIGSGNHLPIPQSTLLDGHPNGALGVPYPTRTLASASEGRSAIMSEIRRVLDLMRRGEGLRIEDMMIVDNSIFHGMADIHDRHRDMRLDVDNMSYEELLALEEGIGDVCTGLSEETISDLLNNKKYVENTAKHHLEATEPCSICREEYMEGDALGTLDCGHHFHTDCIKQWLVLKNLCPICKTTGLTTW